MMVALAAGTALGSAIPPRIGTVTNARAAGGYSIQQVLNPSYTRHGPTELFKAYRKHGGSISDALHATVHNATRVMAAAAASGTGSAATTPQDGDVCISDVN
jgi:hypothetical protein